VEVHSLIKFTEFLFNPILLPRQILSFLWIEYLDENLDEDSYPDSFQRQTKLTHLDIEYVEATTMDKSRCSHQQAESDHEISARVARVSLDLLGNYISRFL
jgi:hypothetical protein